MYAFQSFICVEQVSECSCRTTFVFGIFRPADRMMRGAVHLFPIFRPDEMDFCMFIPIVEFGKVIIWRLILTIKCFLSSFVKMLTLRSVLSNFCFVSGSEIKGD